MAYVFRTGVQSKLREELAKHDEEYMPPEVADALKGMEHLKNADN